MPVGTCLNNDVFRVTARMMVQGTVLFENVFYWRLETDTSFSDVDVASFISTRVRALYTYVQSDLSEGCDFYDILIFNITQNRPIPGGTWSTMTEGGNTSEIAPNGVAALIIANTGENRSRPKKYLGGLTEQNLFGNAWTGTLLTHLASLATLWQSFYDVGSGNGFNPGTWSEKYSAFRPLWGVIVRTAVAYMRKRKPGIGV